MDKEVKLNAVKNLMQSLGFTKEDKEALVQILQQELGVTKKKTSQTGQNLPSPYGEKLNFELLFEDGSTGWYQDRSKRVIGVIVNSRTRSFALYAARNSCPYSASLSTAKAYAEKLPIMRGRKWRVLTESDCYIIRDVFRSLNRTLRLIGSETIVESRTIGVLVSDASMQGAREWQVWFALDL